jgi:L-ascorbate metabolism protein UlaG (beta-lactamase superfamily)
VPTSEDILLTTHAHFDHYNYRFASSFPGKQLCKEEGRIDASDVKIWSIPSSHSEEPPLDTPPYTNMIYVIDINELRLAHFGDTVQLKLTEKQLAELGKVDIAFMHFWGEDERMFKEVKQMKPRVVIPTHLGGDDTHMKAAFRKIRKTWPIYKVEDKQLELSSSRLPQKTSFLLVGERAKVYAKTLRVAKWTSR